MSFNLKLEDSVGDSDVGGIVMLVKMLVTSWWLNDGDRL